MKEEPTRFDVQASGDLTEEHPRRFGRIVVHYTFEGEGLDEGKLRKAVSLSEQRYCGVFATLRGNVELETVIELNGQVLQD
jgi:putative redox protein